MALINFDATTVETPSFDPIPAGVYEAVITESKMQDNKAGNGSMLVLTFEIISGDYAGRKLWEYLNVEHPNATAVEIAYQTLALICKAIGLARVQDSSEMHDRPLLITIKMSKQADGTFRNDIKGFRSREGLTTPTKSPSTSSQATPSAAATPVKGSTPWAR